LGSETPPAAQVGTPPPPERRPGCLGRVFFGGLGVILVGLGVVAAIVPLIPAAPFLLAAVGCFAKASPRLKNRLVNNRWVGSYFGGAGDPRAFTLRGKLVALLVLWVVGLLVAVFLADDLFWRCGVVMTVLTLTIHILLLKAPRTRVPPAPAPPPPPPDEALPPPTAE